MSTKNRGTFITVFALLIVSWNTPDQHWLTEKHKRYVLLYTREDKKSLNDYRQLIENGITFVQAFYDGTYNKTFNIVIHPNRHSLDSSWQKDWNMPKFKSQCWMVASGVASRLDMIAPKRWDTAACEHVYSETKKTQQLITHELVHVYHGQQNGSPDFSNVEGIDWFVEGLATFASGQCDPVRIAEVKKVINENKIPTTLDNFWTGKLKYGLSGSVVMFIDHRYGRSKLKALLPFNKKGEILAALNTTETELLSEWKEFMLSL